jgi:hypothetical protein
MAGAGASGGNHGQGQPSGTASTLPAAFFGGIGSAWILLTLVGAALGGLGAKRLADDLLTRRTATTCPLDH